MNPIMMQQMMMRNALKNKKSSTGLILIICICCSCCVCFLLFGGGIFANKDNENLKSIFEEEKKEEIKETKSELDTELEKIRKEAQKTQDELERTQQENKNLQNEADSMTEEERVAAAFECNNDANCNQSGKCINKKCVCNPNYVLHDCSLNMCPYSMNCVNGYCSEGNCICHRGWSKELDENKESSTYGKEICTKNLCKIPGSEEDKCGRNDNPPRGSCDHDGGCICMDGFSGPTCNDNKCKKKVKKEDDTNDWVDKCKGISVCNINGNCICNCNKLNENKTSCHTDGYVETTFKGTYCNEDMCLINNDKDTPKCGTTGKKKCKRNENGNSIICECVSGFTPNQCYDTNNEQCCVTNQCPDCKYGVCTRCEQQSCQFTRYGKVDTIQKSNGQYYCDCYGTWDGENCDINNCLVKEETDTNEIKYKKDETLDLYVKKCDPNNLGISKCILNSVNREFKECECNKPWKKGNYGFCSRCDGQIIEGRCIISGCNDQIVTDQYGIIFKHWNVLDEQCDLNICNLPLNCKVAAKGNDTLSVDSALYTEEARCRIHGSEQCAIDQCEEGYHYVLKKIDNENLFEHFAGENNPTISPTISPTVSPDVNPTDSPKVNPTDSPDANPSDSTDVNQIKETSSPMELDLNQKIIQYKYGVCELNQCICPNGNPAIGKDCKKHGRFKCASIGLKSNKCKTKIDANGKEHKYYKFYLPTINCNDNQQCENNKHYHGYINNNYKCVSKNECLEPNINLTCNYSEHFANTQDSQLTQESTPVTQLTQESTPVTQLTHESTPLVTVNHNNYSSNILTCFPDYLFTKKKINKWREINKSRQNERHPDNAGEEQNKRISNDYTTYIEGNECLYTKIFENI